MESIEAKCRKPHCSETCQKKQMSISSLPQFLSLHLKRFKQERERKKIDTRVIYPDILDCSPYLSDNIVRFEKNILQNTYKIDAVEASKQ